MQRRQHILVIGNLAFVHFAPPNDALAVDNEYCPPARAALLAPYPVAPGDITFRMEVGEQRERKAAELVGPRPMRMHAVYADTQNLGVGCLEARELALKRGQLIPSEIGPVECVKRENHILLSAIVRECNLLSTRRWQRKVGRFLSSAWD